MSGCRQVRLFSAERDGEGSRVIGISNLFSSVVKAFNPAAGVWWLITCTVLVSSAFSAPVHLRCEYLQNPLGIDALTPHLSWQSDNTERNWREAAYEIFVASGPDRLPGNPDVWDSGKQNSSESLGIAYAGPKLQSTKRYYWMVRVWDANGKQYDSNEQAWWEMGLLEKQDWKAKWITWRNPDEDADETGIGWIWTPGQDALSVPAKTSVVFRLTTEVRGRPRDAALYVIANGNFTATVNGKPVGDKKGWKDFDREDITARLMDGKNEIEVTVSVPEAPSFGPQAGTKTMKGGFAALLKIIGSDGSIVRIPSDGKWKSRVENEKKWRRAQIVARLNDRKMGATPHLPQPAGLLRRDFTVSKQVRAARLYATALGSYRVFINSQKAGNFLLTPDFTDYRKRVLYQTYDVTGLLANGKNTLAAMLGDGWYGSGLTWEGMHFFPRPNRFYAQLELEYSDGTHESVISDERWKSAQSAIVHSEIYSGEFYDARLEQAEWNKAGFNDSRWQAATVAEPPAITLTAQMTLPVHISGSLQPRLVNQVGNAHVFDMGQNMVGWVKLKARGTAGTRLRLRFAERLNPDGSIYTENLRNADATDTYVLRGGGEEVYEPHFTFHGFRYVELTGYPGKPTLSSIVGQVANSLESNPTAKLSTSSDLVNQMYSIGLWGQRGNFLSIPTDCPQRDERLGWMGDAGVFWRTGSYNFDIQSFSHKFMYDVADAQTPQGAFTNVSPNTLPVEGEGTAGGEGSVGAPGWGDAGVIVPYTTWLQYRDPQLVEQSWDAMERWMEFIQQANPDFLRKKGVGPNFADWLAGDPNTNKDLLATAYWALIANMMSEMAHATGRETEARHYADVVASIRSAFQPAYIKEDGTVGTGTQTSYVVALYTKMAPPELESALVDKLVKDIEAEGWHLSTGFLGTPFLLFTLADHGRVDVAYRLLLNETYPSWGYMLSKGATTWWERWNGDSGDPSMNSYNHYAFGSVVAWVYRQVAGIDTSADDPGFHRIVIHPRLDARMTGARAEYDSAYGKIVSDWNGTPQGPLDLKVTIPANTNAKVYLPAATNAHVTQDGAAIQPPQEAESYVVEIGSGSYEFRVE
jgi:alpha-L-rhamnosidase